MTEQFPVLLARVVLPHQMAVPHGPGIGGVIVPTDNSAKEENHLQPNS